MMMISDSERREVARRLRHARTAHEIGEAVGVNCHGGLCNGCASEAAQLLADLIEPSDPKVKCVAEVKVDGWRLEELVHGAAVELTGIDREALLKLADELEEDARWEVQSPGVDNCAWRLKDTCDRIREALGVSGDA